ncbi:MAG: aldo/keto reductase [Acidimicrobiales bacterium]
MDYVQLGRSRAEVSRLCLGTMNFGPKADEAESHTIMSSAIDLGINFFDTANVYGWRKGEGWTEQIVGSWLGKEPSRRDKVVLATKVYGSMGDWPNDQGLSALHIRRACEASLRRLQTDHIDLYQMHHIDRKVPEAELWQALDLLVAQGKILYVGSSNFPGWYLAKTSETAARRGSLGLVSEQPLYNLSARSVELEVLPACQEYGIGVIPWSPLGSGLLGGQPPATAGTGSSGAGRRSEPGVQERFAEKAEQVAQYHDFCAELGKPEAVVALAWLLHQPAVTAPIVGPRTVDQLKAATEALEVDLDEEALARLDKIWPGPGGRAPEAYSW